MSPWVLRLLVANAGVFLLGEMAPRSGERLYELFVLVPALIATRPWTIVTYMFLHQGLGHVFFNMLGLVIFGPRLETHLGGARFVALYLLSGVSGALLSFAFTPFAQIVGASGAILGITLGFARYWPRETIYVWFVPTQVRVLVVVYVVMDVLGGFTAGGDGIAHFAHLGGLAGAYAYLKLIERRPLRSRLVAKIKSIRPAASEALARWSKIDRGRLHPVNREEYDRLMEKIEQDGVGSLNDKERSFLDASSDRQGTPQPS
jgi:membrane associated rhomboid family serine protease